MNFSFFDNKNSFYLVKMYSNHKEKKKTPEFIRKLKIISRILWSK